jgi:hypothetical protein
MLHFYFLRAGIFTAILSARSGKTTSADTNLAEFKQVI